MHLHFYAPIDKKTIKNIQNWNLNKEYYKFAHGVGHNLFELYKRCSNKIKCSIGKEIPQNITLIIIFSKHFNSSKDYLILKKFAVPVIRILSDDKPQKKKFIKNITDVTPYDFHSKKLKKSQKQYLKKIYQNQNYQIVWIPHFIQRGLKSRKISYNKKTYLNITFNGNKHNIPSFLKKKKLLKLGFKLNINSNAKSWNKYSNSHLAICHTESKVDINKYIKPPTKVLNAIAADVVPIADNSYGNVSIIKDYQNGFIYKNEYDFLKILNFIEKNQLYCYKILKNNKDLKKRYSNKNILNLWLNLIKKSKLKKIDINNSIYFFIFFENIKFALKRIFYLFKFNLINFT